MYQYLLTQEADGVLTVTVNRPDKLNALNRATIAELGAVIAGAGDNPDIRAVILTGAGDKAFVAGADISEFAGFDRQQGERLAREGQQVFHAVERCPKPVIAAVNGFALGGGCELAMACHIRIAAKTARFGQPEVKLGLIPGYGGTQRMARLAGKGKALEWLMTADMIDADEAWRTGLVNHVVPPDQLIAKSTETAVKISKQAPGAVAGIIRAVNAAFEPGTDGFETEVAEFGNCCATEDFREGTAAFLEKRKPAFKGA